VARGPAARFGALLKGFTCKQLFWVTVVAMAAARLVVFFIGEWKNISRCGIIRKLGNRGN
jgi:hypothetical protein